MQPQWMLGHSLGEITALTCASSIRLSDAVNIARFRGQVMQNCIQQEDCIMIAVKGVNADEVLSICGEDNGQERAVRSVAGINSPTQVVLSGVKARVLEWKERLEAIGASFTPLKVSAPFHSPLMAPAATALEEHLKQYTFSPLSCKVVSNVTAQPYASHEQIVPLLVQQVTQPVQWRNSMQYLLRQGVNELVDLGPGTVMKKLAEANGSFQTAAIERSEEWNVWVETHSGGRQNLAAAIELAAQCLRHAISTPNLNWDESEYEQGVLKPIQFINSKLGEWEKGDVSHKIEGADIGELLKAVRLVLETKKLPSEERDRRLERLILASRNLDNMDITDMDSLRRTASEF